MGLSTQIGSGTSSTSVREILDRLAQCQVTLTTPVFDTDSLADPTVPAANYQAKLMLFQSIKDCSFHLINNDTPTISADQSLQILYAIKNKRPVVLASMPNISEIQDYIARQLIAHNMSRLYVLDIAHMEADQVTQALNTLPKAVAYDISEAETRAVTYLVRTYFRELLHL